ncbi:hypothetical protein FZC84_17520 [Rossellomorea vietnamensis]|uniref:Uncharacterized protein n=1 Tax=Rossellomorea vietnamensis TaxID=218284 RepID=A0A5D4M8Q8_9BACI|nr:DUF6526 family protein [Rossellomorea vietnamensis]TYR97817.1 hypothetical protein FZC84_17520 [Rossellomorea vietnamensis]
MTIKQDYKNHTQADPIFIGGIGLLSLIAFILSTVFFFQNVRDQWLLSVIVVLFALIFLFVTVRLRGYALKLQDRIIRGEENFRYYRLTGKLLNSELSLKQVIALRFADDAEYPELVDRTVAEDLSPGEIKKAVRNWKADHHRV